PGTMKRMTAMTTKRTVEAIQKRMQVIRHEIQNDAEQIHRRVQVMSDWRHQVRTHPWLTLAIATAAGAFAGAAVTCRLVGRRKAFSPQPLTAPAAQSVVHERAHLGRTLAKAAVDVAVAALATFVKNQIAE